LIGDPAIHYKKPACDDKADYLLAIER
jgi:hypothetical protein